MTLPSPLLDVVFDVLRSREQPSTAVSRRVASVSEEPWR
jgi:hypothetical protein